MKTLLEHVLYRSASSFFALLHRGKRKETAQLHAELLSASHNPKKTVVLCTDERTGSHLLAQILASTGVLGRAYEYFNTSWMKEHHADYPESVAEQMLWAKRLGTTANGVFSLKLHPWAVDRISEEYDIGCDLPDPYFVLLHRNDLLGQAISVCKAYQTNAFTSWSEPKGEPVYDGCRIAQTLHDLALRRERWELFFARNGITPLRLEYADLVRKPQQIALDVARFAGVREFPILNRFEWHRFERQADHINDEWRHRFISEFGGTRRLDRTIDPAVPLAL